jgi:hypothetical protein
MRVKESTVKVHGNNVPESGATRTLQLGTICNSF